MKILSLFLITTAISLVFVSTDFAQPLFVQKAVEKAALPADANGQWVVRADMIIQIRNGERFAAGGTLELKGKVLAGNLALQTFYGNSDIKGNTVYVNILADPSFTVRVRHDIAGKPFLGRPAEVATMEYSFRAPNAKGKVIWDGKESDIEIFLAPMQVKDGGVKPTPTFPNPDPIPSPSAQAEFFDKAFQRAATPDTWNVTARVNMNGHASGKEYISASGKVTLLSPMALGGDLPLSLDNKAIANNTLRITISKSSPSVVRITRMIAGKPYLGRPAKMVSLPIDPNFNYLAGPIEWSDGSRVIQIFLETEPAAPKKPSGARYKITGSVVFTNTDDGFLDNTCEVFGKVMLIRSSYGSGKKVAEYTQLFEIIPQDVTGVQTFPFDKVIDVYDEDKSQFILDGWFYDEDDGPPPYGIKTTTIGKYDDLMWPDQEFSMRINLEKRAGKGAATYPGDRDSENAEVYITVTKISDLYKREPTKTVWTPR